MYVRHMHMVVLLWLTFFVLLFVFVCFDLCVLVSQGFVYCERKNEKKHEVVGREVGTI